MKILVTGGAGFIGSHTALTLEQQGAQVTVLDTLRYGSRKNLNGFKGEFIQGNVCDFELAGFGKLDAIVHEAAIADNTIQDEAFVMSNNAESFSRVLMYAKAVGAKVVYASSSAIYGDGLVPMREGDHVVPTTLYGKSKHRMEQIAGAFSKETGIPLIGLRYFNAFGPKEDSKGPQTSMVWKFVTAMKKGEVPVLFGDGLQRRDFIYIKDMVRITIKALDVTYNGVVNVGTGAATDFRTIIETINRAMGTNIQPTYAPLPFKQYQHYTLASTDRMEQVLGMKPQFSFEEGIRDMVKTMA